MNDFIGPLIVPFIVIEKLGDAGDPLSSARCLGHLQADAASIGTWYWYL